MVKVTQSVKISDKLKEELLRLQARVLLETNRKIPLKDLLEGLVTIALANPDAISRILNKLSGAQPEAQWRKKLENPIDWGIADSSQNIDEHIAGQ